MTKVTYMDNSGFILTLSDVILVFDYYRDPAHALHKALEANPQLPVVFFVSHHHHDHYNKCIFDLAQNHKRVYVLSNDVYGQDIPGSERIAGMSAGDVLENLPGDIKVKAYGSTDAGVSFLVTASDGRKIFHAGDLNDWHWQDDSSEREVRKADEHFNVILNRIASENQSIDIAMFPVDSRQGSDFERGARLFLEKIKVTDFFPMHIHGDFKDACDFSAYVDESVTACHCLHNPGMSTELN